MVINDEVLRMPPLETGRLLIRNLTGDDLEDCHRLYLDIRWARADLSDDDNLERRRSWLEWTVRNYRELARLIQPPYGDRAVVLKDSGRFAGLVGLVPTLKPFAQLPSMGSVAGARFTPEVGMFWATTPAMQRRGIATEAAGALIRYAFEELRLARIIAATDYDNAASIGVMRRLGMRIERNPFPEPEWLQAIGILEAEVSDASRNS